MVGSVSTEPVVAGSVAVLENGQVCIILDDCIVNLTLGVLLYEKSLANIMNIYSSFDMYKKSLV